MRHRIPPLLLALALSLTFAGPALAALPTTGDTVPQVTPTTVTVAVDKVLVKLNALEAQLDAMTVKLDVTTAKLDALTVKTQNIYDTTHYTKGYLQGGLSNVFGLLDTTCNVAQEARDQAAYAAHGTHVYAHIYNCP